MKYLWVEKYRPTTIDEYVFRDDGQKQQIESWIKQQEIPHLLFSGSAGIGKTTLAKILCNELDINEYDIMFSNGSKEGRKIEWVDKLISFCQTIPFGAFKVVIIDEADFLNPMSVQPALRNLMEDYSSTVRFILTCNYPQKIIPALHSRCQGFHIDRSDVVEFTARAATVLVAENIDFELDILDSYVSATYPDLRKCLNQIQVNSSTGKLLPPVDAGKGEDELLFEATQLFKAGKIVEGRQQLLQHLSLYPSRLEDIYRWMYNNLDLWGNTDEKRDASIIIIRNGLANLSMVGIPEISLAATMVELTS
jgi:DNA polymerase III delta prime subunit